jgi:hypothetical protein
MDIQVIPKPDEKKLEVARRLVRIVDVADVAQTILDAISDEFQMTVNERQSFMDTVTADSLLDEIAEIYIDYFSLSELRALEVFYAHGVGKKLVENTPEIMLSSMKLGERFAVRVHNQELERQKGNAFRSH